MRYVERRTEFAENGAEDCRLAGEDGACGVLYGLKATARGLEPRWSAVQTQTSGAPQAAAGGCLTSSGNLYLYDGEGVVYRSTGAAGNFYPVATGLSDLPFFAECQEDGEDFLLISDGTVARVARENIVENDELASVTGGVVHYSRLFGIDRDDKRLIRWSRAGDVHDWEQSLSGGGYVRLDGRRGDVKRLLTYDNKLIAVREYGLTVLRIYGDAENFKVDCTDTDTDGIVAPTAAVCAGKLYFFTQSGLYCYDGTDIESFSPDGLCGFSLPRCAAGFGGAYFAAGKLDGEDVIACIEEDGVCYLKYRADCIFSAGRLLFYGDGLYEIVPQAGDGAWDSGPADLGCTGVKYLSELIVEGCADLLEVSCGGRVRQFTGACGRVKVGLKGAVFRIRAVCPQGLRAVNAKYYLRR